MHAGFLLGLCSLLSTGTSNALPPSAPWGEEELAFRVLLGSLDGSENARLLRRDGSRYTVGFSASSPVAWEERLEANLEVWIHERGYPAAVTAGGSATDTLTFQSASLVYGLRARPLTAVHPYALLAVGFQANRLHARTLATTPVTVQEENLVPTLQAGLGLEWQVGRDLFSLDWRRSYAKGDFTEFGARGLELGGDFLGIGLGHKW